MISEQQSNELRDRLIAERQRLELEIAHIGVAGLGADAFPGDDTDALDQRPTDDGSELFEREKNLSVRRTLETSVQEIDDALRKFADGTYGRCATCGQPIAEKRLLARPEATHCIECQSKLERRSHADTR